MRATPRHVLLGGTVILALGFLVAGGAYLQGGAGPPSEMRYVPADARFVAYASVRDVARSSFWQRLRDVRPELDGPQQFRDATGIDLEADVDSIVASWTPDAEIVEQSASLMLVTGRFDALRLGALARERGGVSEDYAGHTVYSRTFGDDRAEFAMSFVEPEVIAIGSVDMVRQAIDLATSGDDWDDVTTNNRLMTLTEQVHGKHHAWIIATIDEASDLSFLPDAVEGSIPPLTGLAVGTRVHEGVSATVSLQARDEQASQDLRDVVQGFVALARMQSAERPELQGLVDAIQLSSVGTTVTLDFEVPADTLELMRPPTPDQPQ